MHPIMIDNMPNAILMVSSDVIRIDAFAKSFDVTDLGHGGNPLDGCSMLLYTK
jgi:hypothetical protein